MHPSATTQHEEAPFRPTTLLVDDDEDLRETMGELLGLQGLGACVRAASLAEVEAQRAVALDCALAILDLNLGANQPSGVDVYRWLQQAEFGGRVVFLTGYGPDDPLVEEATRTESASIHSKPIAVDELVALVTDARDRVHDVGR